MAEEVVQAIEACCARSFRRVFPPRFSFRRMAEEFVSERRCREQLALARRCLPFDLVGKRVLEIGSAYGMMLAVARLELGVEAFGVEPGEKFEGTFALSGRVLSGLGIDPGIVRQGTGEAIPYESGSFDVVFSWNVLEHVADPAKVFAESVRVLRPGGCLFFVFPNYGSWWEGHYGILWWPDLPRGLAKAYVRLLGRDPAFVDTLQLLNRRRIEQCLAPLEGSVRVREWGTAIWEERLRTLDVADWALLARLRKIVRWVKALGLTELVIRLGRRLSWETPFVLVVEKTSP
ncbi:MAG: class I SAM-dependent methyltransferase [Planctomycetes bacterium]|nr:class I SAM-dependent methyltransferase [Planctomycetota bacterium]